MTVPNSQRLRRIVDQVCIDQQITKLDIDEALGKGSRWTSNALAPASDKGVTESDAQTLYRWLLANAQLEPRDRQHLSVMSATLETARKAREAIAQGHSGRVVPVLIDRRDVDRLASALTTHLTSAPNSKSLEQNIKWFFNRRPPSRDGAAARTYRDLYAFDFRAVAKMRAVQNGFEHKRRVTVLVDGRRVKVGAGDIAQLLYSIDAMTGEES